MLTVKITNIDALLTVVLKLSNPKYINIPLCSFSTTATLRKAYINSLELHVFHALQRTVKSYHPLDTKNDMMHCCPKPKVGVNSGSCHPKQQERTGFTVAKKWHEIVVILPKFISSIFFSPTIFSLKFYINPEIKNNIRQNIM